MNTVKKLLFNPYSKILLGIGIGIFLMLVFRPSAIIHDRPSSLDGHSSVEVSMWTCSMHPSIQQPSPGQCPLCGMDLIPLTSSDDEAPRQLTMSAASMKMAEIQTVKVHREFVEHELRLVGKVEYDETRVKYITAWFPGRLDRLYVDYTGTPVKQGDHLAEIYSPAIVSDQEALLQSLRANSLTGNTQGSAFRTDRTEMLERTRERLRLLGLTEKQIQDIEEKGSTTDRITFFSPMDGIVIHKNALEGDYVQTGNRIYTIADLSQVWVKMDAYESDLQWVHYGQDVEFTTVSYPGRIFKGRISFIDPFMNEQTRTVKVRVNVANQEGLLKPGMFVRATVRANVNAQGELYDRELAGKWISPMHPEIIKDEPGSCDICGMPLVPAETLGFVNPNEMMAAPPLIIPDTAPLITGKRAVVYVKRPNTEKPTFEGRDIVLGSRLKGYYIVETGLEEGEEVVVHGNFKIDSALQIKAQPSMMSLREENAMDGNGHDHSDSAMEPPQKEQKTLPAQSLPDFLAAYKPLWNALADDDLSAAKEQSGQWVAVSKKHALSDVEMMGHGVMHAETIVEARKAFEKMSELVIASVRKHGTQTQDLYLAHCPMAFDNKGAHWLQWDPEILNPYFGSAMLRCGEIKQSFVPATE